MQSPQFLYGLEPFVQMLFGGIGDEIAYCFFFFPIKSFPVKDVFWRNLEFFSFDLFDRFQSLCLCLFVEFREYFSKITFNYFLTSSLFCAIK